MKNILFDIETNGLFEEATVCHSLVLLDIDTGELLSCANKEGYTPINSGLKTLLNAETIVGHNIQGFDIPVLEKLYEVSFHA